MLRFGKKPSDSKQEMSAEELTKIKSSIKVDGAGHAPVSEKTIQKLEGTGTDVFELVEQAKEKRLHELGLEKGDKKIFDLPRTESETRTTTTIEISYKNELDHEALRKKVASGLLDLLQGNHPELLDKNDHFVYKTIIWGDGEIRGRLGTSHLVFANYKKNLFTGIDIYHYDEGPNHAIKHKLMIELNMSAEDFDKELFQEVKSYANRIAIMNEAQLQNFLLK